MDINMKVNVLPALTYNWLHVNESSIVQENIRIDRLEVTLPERVPEGISVETQVPAAKAEEIFAGAAEITKKQNAANIQGPNGDTYSRNAEQQVHTGMGIDADRLMDHMQVTTTVVRAQANRKIVEPLVLHDYMQDGEGSISRQVIHAERGSEITVVMDYRSEEDAAGFHGISTKLYAEQGAIIHLVKVQMLGSGFIHFDDIGGVCEENAFIDLIQMEMGAQKVWNGCHINLLGKESSFQDNTGYLCRYDQQYDMNYVAEQRGRKTRSEMIFRGVLMDQAQKTFRGTIDFRNGSCGSTGDEQEDTLLLSPDVVNRTIPLILCQEEDVDGRHGASIGQLGEDLLFYMQTRGISEEEAKKIMVRARLESIGRLIPEDYLRGTVEDYIRKIL